MNEIYRDPLAFEVVAGPENGTDGELQWAVVDQETAKEFGLCNPEPSGMT
jgi:hypothetical protein